MSSREPLGCSTNLHIWQFTLLALRSMRHATSIQRSQAASFMPNDLILVSRSHHLPVCVLTRPNSGKSTLIQQVTF